MHPQLIRNPHCHPQLDPSALIRWALPVHQDAQPLNQADRCLSLEDRAVQDGLGMRSERSGDVRAEEAGGGSYDGAEK